MQGTDEPLDEAGLEALFRAHARAVLTFLLGLGAGDAARARELLLETFLRAAEGPGPRGGGPLPWLLGIAHQVAQEAGKQAASGEASDAALRAALVLLTPEERSAFLLSHDLGRTRAEVAAALRCSQALAEEHLRAATARLGGEARRRGVTS
jgi:DNA-directed RNA polymerase specialized sigma24 family protein